MTEHDHKHEHDHHDHGHDHHDHDHPDHEHDHHDHDHHHHEPSGQPQEFSEQDRQRIVSTLEARGATLPCPRCGKGPFTMLGGYVNLASQPTPFSDVSGYGSVPCALAACDNCGFVCLHALQAIGEIEGHSH